MNEAVTKRFLLYFRLMMLVWILIANAFFHVIEFDYSWLVFLSNIMLFTMEGDIKDRFISVELGGLVGMVLTVLAMLAIAALTPVLGGLLGLLLPVSLLQVGVVVAQVEPGAVLAQQHHRAARARRRVFRLADLEVVKGCNGDFFHGSVLSANAASP